MKCEIKVDWDVEFWANRYPVHYLAIYNRERDRSAEERLRALWRWKSLNRASYTPGDLMPYLSDARELCDEIGQTVVDAPLEEVADAFVTLRSRLKEPDGPLSSNSRVAVTPQFLLHLADSEGQYSGRFPILDVMVARAHRVHVAGDEAKTLQGTLTCSERSYSRLVGYFFERCDSAAEVARLERALFVQGQAIARYREDQAKFKNMRKVTVGAAREYLDEIRRYGSDS